MSSDFLSFLLSGFSVYFFDYLDFTDHPHQLSYDMLTLNPKASVTSAQTHHSSSSSTITSGCNNVTGVGESPTQPPSSERGGNHMFNPRSFQPTSPSGGDPLNLITPENLNSKII